MRSRHEPAVLNAAEATQARSAARSLAKIRASTARIDVRPRRGRSQELTIPAPALRLLVEILEELAKGNAVTVLPLHAELTSQQAADALNVSRPYLIKLLDEGGLPYRKVGNRRKIRVADLLAFKKKSDVERDAALAELTAEAERLGLGY